MKIAFALLLFGVVPALAQSTNAAPPAENLSSWEQLRHNAIEQCRKKIEDPKTTVEQRAQVADFELALLDDDTKKIDQDFTSFRARLNKLEAEEVAITNAPPAVTPPVPEATPLPSEPQMTTTSGKPLKPGLNIISMDARVSDPGENYDHVAWKTVLYNNGDSAITDVHVHFFFDDKDDFQLEEDLDTVAKIDPHSSVTVSGNTMIKPEVWAKVDGYRVRTE